MSKKEFAGCRAYPTGERCPEEWCNRSQYERMCRGCSHFTSGRSVSIYQQSHPLSPLREHPDGHKRVGVRR